MEIAFILNKMDKVRRSFAQQIIKVYEGDYNYFVDPTVRQDLVDNVEGKKLVKGMYYHFVRLLLSW